MNENISARDWINLENLFALNNELFIDPVVDCLAKAINFSAKGKCIVGINHYGAILASIIGYKYEVPFTYYFDDKKIVDISEKETGNLCKKELILIVDVMVSGNTICDVINYMFAEGIIDTETRLEIVVLFERKRKMNYYSNAYGNIHIKKIHVLNDDFEIEICNKKKDKCIFRKNGKMCK